MSLIHELGGGIGGKAPSNNHGECGGSKKRDVTAATTESKAPAASSIATPHPHIIGAISASTASMMVLVVETMLNGH